MFTTFFFGKSSQIVIQIDAISALLEDSQAAYFYRPVEKPVDNVKNLMHNFLAFCFYGNHYNYTRKLK